MNLIEEKAYKHIGIEWPDLPETILELVAIIQKKTIH